MTKACSNGHHWASAHVGIALAASSLSPILRAVALFLGLWRSIPFKKKALEKRETDDVWAASLSPDKSSKMRSNPNGYRV